jgi:hypothetical protein
MKKVCLGEDVEKDMWKLLRLSPDYLLKLTAVSLAGQHLSTATLLLTHTRLAHHRKEWSGSDVLGLCVSLTNPLIKGSSKYQQEVPGEEVFYLLFELDEVENLGISSYLQLLEAVVLCGWDASDVLGELGGPLTLQEMVRLYQIALLGPRPSSSIRSVAELQGTLYASVVLPYEDLWQLLQLAIKQPCGAAVDHFLSLLAARGLNQKAVQQLIVLALTADPRRPQCMDCWKCLVNFSAPLLFSSMDFLEQVLTLCARSSGSSNSSKLGNGNDTTGGCCCGHATRCYTCNLLECLIHSSAKEGVVVLLRLHDVALHHHPMLAAVSKFMTTFNHDAKGLQQIITALLSAQVVNMDHSFWSSLLKQQSAQEMSVEVVGELLGAAMVARRVGPLAHLLGALDVVKELPEPVAHGLVQKCFPKDDWRPLQLLERHLPAVQRFSEGELAGLILEAAAHEAGCCAARLLALLRVKTAEVPVCVREALVPVLAQWKCPHQCEVQEGGTSTKEARNNESAVACLACGLMKQHGATLPAEVIAKTLIGAAKPWQEVMHLQQLSKLPGLQNLGEEQVVMVLLSVLQQQKVSKDVKTVKVAQLASLMQSSMQRLSQAAVARLEEVAAAAACFIGGDMVALRRLLSGGGV